MPLSQAPKRLRLLLTAIAIVACASSADAICMRSGDEIVVVNVRNACCSTNPATLMARTRVTQYIADDAGNVHWIPSDFDSFLGSTDASKRTVIWVHGNRIEPSDACYRGLRVYQSLTRCASDADGPIRFVIFSWPAEQQPGPLRDFREKAQRTRPVGWQLAYLVNRLPADQPISMIGYSYGARIIGGALHLLGGGDLGCGLKVDNAGEVPRPAMPVVFIAAATHAHWFGPNQFHSNAMQRTGKLLLTTNQDDPAMKFYRLVDTNSSALAMGLCGPTCLNADEAARVRLVNVTCAVGSTHDLYRYMAVGSFMSEAWDTLVP